MRVSADDSALLADLAAERPEAEAVFEQRYRPRFELIARYSGVPLQDCQDVAQDAMIAAFSQIRRGLFRRESSLGTWLEIIVRGKIADYKRASRPSVSIHGFSGDDSTGLDVILCDRPVYEIQLTVREILAKMSPKHRMILILNRIVGFTIEEISIRTEWPAGTVGRILAEARHQFKELLANSEKFD